VETTQPDEDGVIHVTLEIAEDSIQQRAMLYDKDGDAHYDTISAFIKSLRGSDPDAALYWLARMIHSGEDPRFIVRRMIILASEDIGNADPRALAVATSAAQALEWVGLPEAQYSLAQAAIYLATAPKSNSAGGYFEALADVKEEGAGEVPDHLKDPSRDAEALGHGRDYKYPHQYPGHFVRQQYLPDRLQGKRYYEPSAEGYEREISERLRAWRQQDEEG
jgi:putative ATPase